MKMAISQGLTDLNEIKRMYDASIPNIEASSVNNTYSSVPYNPSPKDVRYDDGGRLAEVIVTPNKEYNIFLNSLPPNQKYGDDNFNTYRYWELYGKPADFEAALKTNPPMYTLEDDGYYHASSVAYNRDNDTYEFMKSPDHPTVDLELLQYWNNPELNEFRDNYGLDLDSNPYKYIRRGATNKPLYAYGGPLGNIYKGTGNKSQKLNIWTSGAWTAKDLADELKRRGIRAKVTSGYRSAAKQSQFGTPANKSWHVKNKAIDVVPTAGWDNLIADLTTPENQQFFASIGVGVLDERPLSVQRQTKATGAHFHIGPDKRARANYAQWISKDFAKNNTPQIDYNSPIYDTSWQSIQWQPPVVSSSRQEDISPLLVQDNKPLIVEPLEDTSSTPKDFSAIWDQIFPKVENTQEEFNPLLDPITLYSSLQSRPRYQMKPTPIINMSVSDGDNDYMLFRPLT